MKKGHFCKQIVPTVLDTAHHFLASVVLVLRSRCSCLTPRYEGSVDKGPPETLLSIRDQVYPGLSLSLSLSATRGGIFFVFLLTFLCQAEVASYNRCRVLVDGSLLPISSEAVVDCVPRRSPGLVARGLCIRPLLRNEAQVMFKCLRGWRARISQLLLRKKVGIEGRFEGSWVRLSRCVIVFSTPAGLLG